MVSEHDRLIALWKTHTHTLTHSRTHTLTQFIITAVFRPFGWCTRHTPVCCRFDTILLSQCRHTKVQNPDTKHCVRTTNSAKWVLVRGQSGKAVFRETPHPAVFPPSLNQTDMRREDVSTNCSHSAALDTGNKKPPWFLLVALCALSLSLFIFSLSLCLPLSLSWALCYVALSEHNFSWSNCI